MEQRKNPLTRIQVVALMLHIIRNEVESRIEQHQSKLQQRRRSPKQREALDFCQAIAAMLRNTQALLCESMDDPALAALAPHVQEQSGKRRLEQQEPAPKQHRQGRPGSRNRDLRLSTSQES